MADVHANFHVANETVLNDLKVEFAHASDNGLSRLIVVLRAEGGVFAANGDQRVAKLLAIIGRLRLNRHRDDGVGEVHPLQDDWICFRAQRVSSHRVFEANHGDDLPSFARVECVAVLGVHFEDSRDVLFLVVARVQQT